MLLQRLYATVWYVNVFGDMTMKYVYDRDECDALLNNLKKRQTHYRIEYEDA